MKNPVALLGSLSLLLYALSFALPDHWWQGPVSVDPAEPPTSQATIVRYMGSLIAATFQQSLRADRLDWAGWAAHGLQWLGYALLTLRLDRTALAVSALAFVFSLARIASVMPSEFMAGYYLWLASLVALGGAAFWGFRIAKRRELGKWGRRLRNLTAQLITLAVAAFVVWYLTCTGPRDLSLYPDSASSPYRLPYPGGTTCLCAQGNRAVVSHRSMSGGSEYAFDFAMPVGSDVVAARGGRVARVGVVKDGFGAANNNEILVDHGDGTFGCYMHLMKGGSFVKLNDRVAQGQLLAASGNTGTSTGPHLHFMVLKAIPNGWEPVPIAFADVATDQGVPRMLKWYTSGNGL